VGRIIPKVFFKQTASICRVSVLAPVKDVISSSPRCFLVGEIDLCTNTQNPRQTWVVLYKRLIKEAGGSEGFRSPGGTDSPVGYPSARNSARKGPGGGRWVWVMVGDGLGHSVEKASLVPRVTGSD
jgi:hypothetical protein